MSHTTEITSVSFSDIKALESAVSDLQSQGIRCKLETGGKPRGYYNNQMGLGAADYVLRLEDSPYDVGFYKSGKGYAARTDLFNGHVSKILGVPVASSEPGRMEMASLGKLNQAYAVHSAIRQATKQGHTVRRINKPDGSIQLVMEVGN